MACWVNPDGTIQCSDLSTATTTAIAGAFGQHAKDSKLVRADQAAQVKAVNKKLTELGGQAVVLVLEPGELP